jgi:hypothetical protein
MADLTQQDLDSYNKLKEAFLKIKTINNDGIIKVINQRILATKSVKNTEELSEIVNPLYSYWKISSNLGKPIEFNEVPAEPKKSEQQFSDAIESLKRSLQIVEDENLDLTDEIETFQPDSSFLGFIKNMTLKKLTEDLISDRDPELDEGKINELTQAWGTAVDKFVRDARNSEEPGEQDTLQPGNSTTFASFFRIHKELEILYSRLADSETVQLA